MDIFWIFQILLHMYSQRHQSINQSIS